MTIDMNVESHFSRTLISYRNIATMSVNNILRKCNAGYKYTKEKKQLMDMNDLKRIAKCKKGQENLINTTTMFS